MVLANLSSISQLLPSCPGQLDQPAKSNVRTLYTRCWPTLVVPVSYCRPVQVN